MLKKATIEVVLFDTAHSSDSDLAGQIKLLGEFYGIHHVILSATQDAAQQLHLHLKKTKNKIITVIINAEGLVDLEVQNLQSLLLEQLSDIPVLITGVHSSTSIKNLQAWVGDVIHGVHDIQDFSGHYFFHAHPITKQLGNQSAPWKHPAVSYLQLNTSNNADIIIELEQNERHVSFIRTEHQGLSVFVSSYVQPTPLYGGELIWRFKPRRFMQMAALMLVIQDACGEYCWHMPKRFANFTIDDPWLTEPYGQLNFQGLLDAMKQAKFHTTIAFIPWNYDRSESEAVEIFKNNPEYYSLCVHGNNHDHREFYKYSTNEDDPWPAKPLEVHDFNLQQGLARLDKLQEMTGLDYDRVMVFPHNIAPEATLQLMKKYNFLATSNGGNVPLDSDDPENPLFYFRTVSTHFANFPSFDRVEPEDYLSMKIALHLYLGNPMLFFEHILYFADGVNVFNETAERVNRIQPDIQWASLGEIARHMYEQRKVSDNEYEVKAFSRQFKLYNPSSNVVHFTVFKAMAEDEEIASISYNGKVQNFDYKQDGGYLELSLAVSPRETQLIDIQYANELDLNALDVSKNNSRVNRLRWFSDFRDITFSGSKLGGLFTKWYYNSGHYQGGIKRILLLAGFGIIGFGLVFWLFIRHLLRPKREVL